MTVIRMPIGYKCYIVLYFVPHTSHKVLSLSGGYIFIQSGQCHRYAELIATLSTVAIYTTAWCFPLPGVAQVHCSVYGNVLERDPVAAVKLYSNNEFCCIEWHWRYII